MSAAAAAPLDPVPTNPFPGLRPFHESEAHLYFGREREVDAMVDKLAAHRLLAVLGSSGSGKSSLVNCGLRPALHTGLLAAAGTAWRVVSCRPGADPVGALARAMAEPGLLFSPAALPATTGFTLAQAIETTLRMSRLGLLDAVRQARLAPGVNVLVVIDQFEELFRYRRLGGPAAVDDAATLVGLLLQAQAQRALPVYVVLTMRSDFLGECSAIEGLAQAINDGQHLVPRMTRDERRAAIAGPVAVAGGRIDPVLLTRLVNDVGDDPDQLSTLQHALNRSWAHWQARGGPGALALADYEDAAVGTMANALDRHAEQAWAALPDDAARATCERLLRALTDRATDPRGVRRPARLAALCDVTGDPAEALCAVIEVLRSPERSFLMPPLPEPLQADTVIDIAHESLMRIWRRLQGWADDEARSAEQLRRLADASGLHAQGRGGLWRDPELHFAEAWCAQARPNPAWAAQYGVALAPALGFLQDSALARAAAQAVQARQRARRRLAWSGLVAGLAAVGLLFLALWQRSEQLLVEAQAANLRKMVLQSRAMLDGEVPTTLDVALLVSAAAFRLGATNESYGGLQFALQRTAPLQRVLALPGPVLGFSPDQRSAAVVDGTLLRLHDATTGAARGAALQGHGGTINAVAFSADSRRLATASDDRTVRLWDAASGAALGEALRGHANRVWCVAFSPDGRLLASGDEDARIRLWDSASGRLLAELRGHDQRIWALAFSPDGQRLASASDDRSLRLWDLASGQPHGPALRGHDGVVSALAFSPDGSRLASAGGDQTLRLWDVASGRPIGAPGRGHSSRIWAVAFSPDGRRLASAGEDQTVRLWSGSSAQPLGEPLRGHKSRVWQVAFAADGASLLSAGRDRMLLRWRGDGTDLADAAPLLGHRGAVRAVASSPDGASIASGGDDGDVRLWDVARRSPRGPPLRGDGAAVSAVAFSPDGASLASAGEDGRLRLWDAASGSPLGAPLVAGPGAVWALAYSPDGRSLASGGADGALRLWDLASRRQRGAAWTGHAQAVWSVAFSPDGRRLASGGDDATVRQWDTATGAPLGAPLTGHAQRVWSVAFSPDGSRLVSASEDGSLRLWDAASGAPLGPPLLGHLQPVTAVAFSPDGASLASASDDATLRFWDAHSGEPRGAPLHGHRDAVVGLAFSRDGRSLVSASVDASVRTWDTPDAWISRLCAKLTHNLGRDDWRRLVGAIDYQPPCPQLPQRPGADLRPPDGARPAPTAPTAPTAPPPPSPPLPQAAAPMAPAVPAPMPTTTPRGRP